MGSPLAWLHLTLVTLKGQCEGDSDFEAYVSHKVSNLGH